MNPLRLEYLDPAQLADHPENWKFHPAEQLEAIGDIIGEVGWAGALLFNEQTGHLLDGHGRKEKFAGQPVPVLIGSWSEEQERQILAYLDPVGYAAVPNREKVEALLKRSLPLSERSASLKNLLTSLRSASSRISSPADATDPAAAEARPDEKPEVQIPLDSIWPTDNAFSIPCLDPVLQGWEVPHPVMTWGSVGHTRPMPGTWHFYIHDHKFEPLWRRPERVLKSGPGAAVEPNFSATEQTPIAVALWHIYRKRWLARYWQSQGLKVFVDLNTDGSLNQPHEATGGLAPNLLGVPRGWKAYASRAHANQPDNLVIEWDVAKRHAESDSVLFLVVGGGGTVRKLAQQHGWVWVPEQIQTKFGTSDQVEAA